jgi:hypothetical protein
MNRLQFAFRAPPLARPRGKKEGEVGDEALVLLRPAILPQFPLCATVLTQRTRLGRGETGQREKTENKHKKNTWRHFDKQTFTWVFVGK